MSINKISAYPGGFTQGVSVQNLPVLNTFSQKVFWVDSNTGSDNNKGTFTQPTGTVAGAIAKATADSTNTGKGGVGLPCLIMVKPDHAETVTAALSFARADTHIVGMGMDTDLPTFTFTTAAAAGISLSSANMSLENVALIDNVGVTAALILANTNCLANNVRVYDGSSSFTTGISVAGGGANLADKCKITGCYIFSAGATNGVLLGEVDDQVQVSDNIIRGSYSQSAIHNPTAKVATLAQIHRNYIHQTSASGWGIRMISAVTGEAYENKIFVSTVGQELSAGSMALIGNLAANALGTAGGAVPANDNSEKVVVGGAKTLPATTTQSIFTVTGPVQIIDIFGEVTTTVQTQACNFKYSVTDTVSSTTVDLCANASITAAALGTFIWPKLDLAATATQITAGGTAIGPGGSGAGAASGGGEVRCPAGVILVTTGATNTGALTYHCRYRPLAPGATVTAL